MRRFGPVIVMALLVTGCATAPQSYPPQRPRPTPVPRPIAGVPSPATYVAQAASIDLFVVRASDLAMSRSASPSIRNLAARLKAAHEGTASQLSFAGRRLDLLPAASLLPEHQVMLDQLNSSSDFDRTFVRLQRAIHGSALALHTDYARRGTSPTLRPVAANAAAVERADLDLLRRIG